jgi:chromosome segregation ATPase
MRSRRPRPLLTFVLGVLCTAVAAILIWALGTNHRPTAQTQPEASDLTAAEQAGEHDAEARAYEALKAEYAQLQQQADGLRADIERVTGETAVLKETLANGFADHELLRSQAANAEVRLAEANAALDATKADLAAAGARTSELEGKLKGAADLVATLNNDLRDARDRADRSAADAKSAKDAADAAKGRADALQKSLDEANASLEATKKVLEAKTSEVASLQAQIEALKKQLEGPAEGSSQ